MTRRKLPRRNQSARDKGKKGVPILFGWVRVIIILTVIAFLVYGFLFTLKNLYSGKVSCSICDNGEKILRERQDVTSTLYLMESEDGERIEHVWLYIHNLSLGKTFILYIPSGVYVADPNNLFTSYLRVSDFLYTGKLLNERRAIGYTLWQVQNLTGFTFDSYVWIGSEARAKLDEVNWLKQSSLKNRFGKYYLNGEEITENSLILHSLHSEMSVTSILAHSPSWRGFYESIDSSYSASGIFSYFLITRGRLNAGSIYLVDLSLDKYIIEGTDQAERIIPSIRYGEFDKVVSLNFNLLRSREVEKEQAKVEVYNGSGIPGLASRYARRVQNFGIKVVRFDNAPGEFEKTIIFVPSIERFSKSFESVKNLICDNCDVVYDRPSFITTGDIVVVLGRDKENEISWK